MRDAEGGSELAAIELETFETARRLGHLRLCMSRVFGKMAREYMERAKLSFADAERAAIRFARAVDTAGLDPLGELTSQILAEIEKRDERESGGG